MSEYYLGIGSNIDPEFHIAQAIVSLTSFAPRLHLSRILVTAPVEIESESLFLNLAACFSSPLSQSALKERLNRLEVLLGRDRGDPLRKVKDRSIDLDILFSLQDGGEGQQQAPPLPEEPYLRPQVQELLEYLDRPCDPSSAPLPTGKPLALETLTIGQGPRTIGCGRDGRLFAATDPWG